MLLAAPAAAAATPSTDASAYAAEVGRVLEQVVAGQAAAAAAEMRAGGLDSSEPEIYRDLNQQPPDLADAEARLRALQAALGAPATGGDPAQEHAQIQKILSLRRYAGNQPSAWDRFWNWVGDRIAEFLDSLARPALGFQIPTWVWLAALAVAVLLAALGVLLIGGFARSSRRRRRAAELGPEPARMVRERFREADRRAAAGDWDGAVRALAEAVATRLSGEPWWATSPQTLRELFRQVGWLEALRPLLLAFEMVVYARRSIDEPAYRAAEAAAVPVRVQPPPAEEAAA
ncbi:MAG: hypothetical protein E6I08_07655 [Chloroflexi bacterium]|nr:MAG: hypothetical protein E6I08_07655 [Chloroflexota bacterium]